MTGRTRKWLHFYGIADDIFLAEGYMSMVCPRGQDNRAQTGMMRIRSSGGGVLVSGRYVAETGRWLMGISPVPESGVEPEWPVQVTVQKRYGTRLSVEVPVDATVTVHRQGEEGESPEMMKWG